MSRQADTARRILTSAHRIARDIDTAITQIANNRGGYPTQVPGAAPASSPAPVYDGPCTEPSTTVHDSACHRPRPCPDHDTPVHLTGPEKATLNIDRAALDDRRLKRYLKEADEAMKKALAIVDRWQPAVTDQAVAKQLAADERSLWCHNCASHGISEVREEGRHSCQFCRKFNATWGTYPNLAILEIHARRTVTHQDAVRILDRDQPGWRKTMPKPKSAPKTKTVARRKNGRAA